MKNNVINNVIKQPVQSKGVRQKIKDVLLAIASTYELKEDKNRANAFVKAARLVMEKGKDGKFVVSLSEPTKTKGVGEVIGKVIMNTQINNESNYQFRMKLRRILNEFAIAYTKQKDKARSDAFRPLEI